MTLSTLLRGSIYEKLRWTFKLYDINGDGCITRGELGEVVTAVHELMGRRHHADEERKAREQLDRVFKKLDLNQDGVITIEEFIESCLKVRLTVKQVRSSRCTGYIVPTVPFVSAKPSRLTLLRRFRYQRVTIWYWPAILIIISIWLKSE